MRDAEEEHKHTSCRTRNTDEVRLLSHERNSLLQDPCGLYVRQASFVEKVVLQQLEIRFPSARRGVKQIELRILWMVRVWWRNLAKGKEASTNVLTMRIGSNDLIYVEYGRAMSNRNAPFSPGAPAPAPECSIAEGQQPVLEDQTGISVVSHALVVRCLEGSKRTC